MSEAGEWREFLGRLPKAELHVHLEGAIEPELLLALAARRRVDLPAGDAAGLREWMRFRDFEHFVDVYLTCSRCLRDPEDFQRLLDDFASRQEAQNVVYTEVHFTISTHLANGANGDEVGQALGEAIVAAERRRGVTIRLIPDIVRNLERARADRTIEWALEHRRHGVVALGLGGIEDRPAAPFGEHFRAARQAGLHVTAHAGEQCGPERVREVLEVCRPERVGHGIRVLEDPELTARLAADGVPLEVCPTSNVRLGYAASLAEHPFPRLVEAGLAVSLGSDDPTLFSTTLLDELAAVATAFDYSRGEMAGFARAAFEHAFLEPGERRAFVDRFEAELADA